MNKKKIVSKPELAKIVHALKQQGKKVVFTNGCFDLIHAGHVHYLSEAKSAGDILIVGLNADKSVSRIKPGRPIVPEAHRATVLSALSMVDYVVLFNEDTPYELIKALTPDVLVKGADWKKEDIVGNDIVSDVRTIPFVEGLSTREIIRKIRDTDI